MTGDVVFVALGLVCGLGLLGLALIADAAWRRRHGWGYR